MDRQRELKQHNVDISSFKGVFGFRATMTGRRL
jgi:hypothetical protein